MESFTACRRDGKLVLEIDERQFLSNALGNPANNLALTDAGQFLDFATAHFFTLTHDIDENGGTPSWWQRFSEALGKAAGAAGQGVRKLEVAAPTCGCDPEIYDGG